MTEHKQFPTPAEDALDRAREDRVVAFLRSRGVFGATHIAAGHAAIVRRRRRWRGPMIAAAAAVVLAVVSAIVDRTRRSDPQVVSAEAPTLLIWY